MNKLPSTERIIETLTAKTDAVDFVDNLLSRNIELEEIFQVLQPLLYELSLILYKDNDEPVSLSKLVAESVEYLKGARQ